MLSVSVSTVRLGQDRLSGVLASDVMLGSERHPILPIIACQQPICNFDGSFKLMQRTVREGMNNFLRYKSVPLPQHPCSHNCAERFTYFHLASTVRRPPQRPSGRSIKGFASFYF